MTNQRMPDARKAELRDAAKLWSTFTGSIHRELAGSLTEALDALDAAEAQLAGVTPTTQGLMTPERKAALVADARLLVAWDKHSQVMAEQVDRVVREAGEKLLEALRALEPVRPVGYDAEAYESLLSAPDREVYGDECGIKRLLLEKFALLARAEAAEARAASLETMAGPGSITTLRRLVLALDARGVVFGDDAIGDELCDAYNEARHSCDQAIALARNDGRG